MNAILRFILCIAAPLVLSQCALLNAPLGLLQGLFQTVASPLGALGQVESDGREPGPDRLPLILARAERVQAAGEFRQARKGNMEALTSPEPSVAGR